MSYKWLDKGKDSHGDVINSKVDCFYWSYENMFLF